jgi:hypothetical protein
MAATLGLVGWAGVASDAKIKNVRKGYLRLNATGNLTLTGLTGLLKSEKVLSNAEFNY